MKIKKAIIPAAGLGTRFLPATKAMPKEMLPIVDKPTIEFIVEEALDSGINDIIIVTGKGKRAIEDHFDIAFELEHNLIEREKGCLLEKVRHSAKFDIHYIRQKEPLGLGHAVWCARHFIGNEPFAVLLGDDIIHSSKPCLKQMMELFEQLKGSILAVQRVPKEEVNKYGICSTTTISDKVHLVNSLVEKPNINQINSDLAIMGRYILTPRVFEILEKQKVGSGGEVQLTDAIDMLRQSELVYSFEFDGTKYDVGDKLGYIKTTIDFAMKRPELRSTLIQYMKETIEKEVSGVL